MENSFSISFRSKSFFQITHRDNGFPPFQQKDRDETGTTSTDNVNFNKVDEGDFSELNIATTSTLNVIGATDRDYGKYIDGKYDEKFVLEMERFVSLAYDECALQVSASLRKSDVKYSNNRVLIHRTVDKLLQKYPRDEIRFGMSDSVIYNVYKESVEQLIKEVKNYVRKFLDNKMVVLGVQYDKVTEYVLKKVIVDGDIDPDDLPTEGANLDLDYQILYVQDR